MSPKCKSCQSVANKILYEEKKKVKDEFFVKEKLVNLVVILIHGFLSLHIMIEKQKQQRKEETK